MRRLFYLLLSLSIAYFSWACSEEPSTAPDAGAVDDATPACEAHESDCDGRCIDLDTDPRHCGQCGAQCEAWEHCDDGSCAVACPTGQHFCSDGCFDLDRSTEHCGECGHSCQSQQRCNGGTCETSCGEGYQECGGTCRDITVDPLHCGDCDSGCDGGEVCSNGTCQTTCAADLSDCDNSCRNLASDPEHCGECGHACPGSFGCIDGQCHGIDDYPTLLEGLQLWLRADSGVDSAGGDAQSWQNQVHLDQVAGVRSNAASPNVAGESAGSNPALRFNGTNQAMALEEFAYPNQVFTHTLAFIPHTQLDEYRDQTMTLHYGHLTPASTRLHISINEDGDGTMGMYLEVDGERSASATTTTDRWFDRHPYLVTFAYDGDQVAIYVNGELDATDDFDGPLQWQQGFDIGAKSDGDHFAGDLLEMLVLDQHLDDDQIAALHAYLSNRYHLYFDDAPWIDDYPDEHQELIESYELSGEQVIHSGFETIDPQPNCADHLQQGLARSGLYTIEPGGEDLSPVVFCDMDTDGGGWTQIANVQQSADSPYPGREFAGQGPHQLGHSVDIDGFWVSEIALTHHGLDEMNIATFELDSPTEWDNSTLDLRFLLDNGNFALFGLSEAESGGLGNIAMTCLNSTTDNCLEVSRDVAFGAASAGTGSCARLNRSTNDGCGAWGAEPHIGDTTWTVHGGRILLR